MECDDTGITRSTGCFSKSEASQSEVDKVYIELVTAFLNLRFKSVEEVDKTELEELSKKQKATRKKNIHQVHGMYSRKPWMQAKEVAANENATEAEVEKAVRFTRGRINALTRKQIKVLRKS